MVEQGSDTPGRVGVGVAVVVGRDGPTGSEVLLVQRRYHGHGSWSPIGGYIDPGEQPEASCHREVREESGLTVSDLAFACVTNDIHDDGKHNVTLWFTADADRPDQPLRLSDESLAIAWFRWDQLPSPLYRSFENYLNGPTWPAHRGGQRAENGV